MSGFNQVILLGRLGNDPETKYTQGGTAVASLSIATSRRRKDGAGEWVEETAWHRVKAFGKQAEVIAEHCRKGDLLFVEGRLDYWEAEGKRGKLMVAEVILEHFEFTGGSKRSGDGQQGQASRSGSAGGSRGSSAPRGAQRGPAGGYGGSGGAGRYGDAPASSQGPSGDMLDDDIPF